MIFEVDWLTPEQWKPLSENAHLIAFGEHKPSEWDRIDFALIVKTGDRLLGYGTFKELDSKTVYWQFGGAFPGTKDSSLSFPAYRVLVDWTKTKYDRLATYIENDNMVMLKFAMRVGYRIIGVRLFRGKVLLEHLLEFPK